MIELKVFLVVFILFQYVFVCTAIFEKRTKITKRQVWLWLIPIVTPVVILAIELIKTYRKLPAK